MQHDDFRIGAASAMSLDRNAFTSRELILTTAAHLIWHITQNLGRSSAFMNVHRLADRSSHQALVIHHISLNMLDIRRIN